MSIYEKREAKSAPEWVDTMVLSRAQGEAEDYEELARIIRESDQFKRLQAMGMVAPYMPQIQDKVRNRATHSEEVAATACEICDALHLGKRSRALSSVIALAHDIGHPPFSHEGEEAINRRLRPLGIAWDHDHEGVETLAKIDGLAGKSGYAELLEGAIKRHRRYPDGRDGSVRDSVYVKRQSTLPKTLVEAYEACHESPDKARADLGRFSHVEGQVAATADWIAGSVSDIEDMVTYYLAGKAPAQDTKKFIDELCEFFEPAQGLREEVNTLFFDALRARCLGRTPETGLDGSDVASARQWQVKQFCAKLKTMLLNDVVQQTRTTLHTYHDVINAADDVKRLPQLMVTPSPSMCAKLNHLKQFYQERVYPNFCIDHEDTELMVGVMFDDFYYDELPMPGAWGAAFQEIANRSCAPDSPEEKEQLKDKALLVAEYLSQLHDVDVRTHIAQHHPELARVLHEECEHARSAHHVRTEPPRYREAVRMPKQKPTLETTLNGLRDGHKLALHVWENNPSYQFPEGTIRTLNVPASHIRGRLSRTFQNPHDGMPLTSMTLLPSGETGKSIRPWGTSARAPKFGTGYLFNLDQDQYYPPRVVRVDSGNLASGSTGIYKANGLREECYIEELDQRAYYEPAAADIAAWKKRVASPQGRLMGEEQLGALGRHYEVKRPMRAHYDSERGILAHNEILVAAAKTHISAIFVPFFSNTKPAAWYSPVINLTGALAGLQHIKEGMPLPVVRYHVSPEVKDEIPGAKRGGFSVIGENAKDFISVAEKAIRDLQTLGIASQKDMKSVGYNVNYPALQKQVLETTGIDIAVPLDEQRAALETLKAQFRCEGEGQDRSAA